MSAEPAGPTRRQDLLVPRSRPTRRVVGLPGRALRGVCVCAGLGRRGGRRRSWAVFRWWLLSLLEGLRVADGKGDSGALVLADHVVDEVGDVAGSVRCAEGTFFATWAAARTGLTLAPRRSASIGTRISAKAIASHTRSFSRSRRRGGWTLTRIPTRSPGSRARPPLRTRSPPPARLLGKPLRAEEADATKNASDLHPGRVKTLEGFGQYAQRCHQTARNFRGSGKVQPDDFIPTKISSTFARAQGFFRRNVRLDLMLGSNMKQRISTRLASSRQP
jgi:hypothetical protein